MNTSSPRLYFGSSQDILLVDIDKFENRIFQLIGDIPYEVIISLKWWDRNLQNTYKKLVDMTNLNPENEENVEKINKFLQIISHQKINAIKQSDFCIFLINQPEVAPPTAITDDNVINLEPEPANTINIFQILMEIGMAIASDHVKHIYIASDNEYFSKLIEFDLPYSLFDEKITMLERDCEISNCLYCDVSFLMNNTTTEMFSNNNNKN